MWLTHIGKTNPEIDVFRDVLSIKNGKMSSQKVSLLLFVHKPFLYESVSTFEYLITQSVFKYIAVIKYLFVKVFADIL